MGELQRSFRPEFLNRIDDIMVFSRLDKDSLHRIVELQLSYLRQRLGDKKITLEVTEPAKDLLLTDGYDEQFGARPLKRAIQRLIQDPLALKLLDGEIGEGDTVTVERDGDEDRMRFAVKKAVKEEEVLHA
jgi:ATP-dependent Clp protease ATP-binding subunit ClpB